ncbi:SRPBCC family protein [Streptomyces sp. NPDC002055]|uniref:SRPBCC family protein n=1 Tax=Streptomyces sp. NPDC002055 TaxID=3154534 RepID=UPI00332C997E
MAKADGDTTGKGGPGFDQLREELGNYLMARTSRWVESAGDKLTGLTDQLNGGDGGSGGMLAIGKRVLGGENPMKAFLGEKARGVKDKVLGGVKDAIGGGGDGKAGNTKVTNIIEVLDVGLPVRTVYDCWTQFEDFSSFTKGVTSVKISDEIESDWKLKVAFSNPSWKATVEEQVPDERIVWNSEGAKGSTRGVVSFHELTPNLTHIVAVVDYYPSGFFEKTGNLWRAQELTPAGEHSRHEKHHRNYKEDDDSHGNEHTLPRLAEHLGMRALVVCLVRDKDAGPVPPAMHGDSVAVADSALEVQGPHLYLCLLHLVVRSFRVHPEHPDEDRGLTASPWLLVRYEMAYLASQQR